MMGFEVSYCHLVRPSLVNAHTLVCFCVCVGGVVLWSNNSDINHNHGEGWVVPIDVYADIRMHTRVYARAQVCIYLAIATAKIDGFVETVNNRTTNNASTIYLKLIYLFQNESHVCVSACVSACMPLCLKRCAYLPNLSTRAVEAVDGALQSANDNISIACHCRPTTHSSHPSELYACICHMIDVAFITSLIRNSPIALLEAIFARE